MKKLRWFLWNPLPAFFATIGMVDFGMHAYDGRPITDRSLMLWGAASALYCAASWVKESINRYPRKNK